MNIPFQKQAGNQALSGLVVANTTSAPTSLKINTSASVPTASNDSSQGYSVGSVWFQNVALGNYFVCTNTTVASAVWTPVRTRIFSDTGAANVYVVNVGAELQTSLPSGFIVRMLIANTNTTASTVNVNGIGAVTILKNGTLALSAGDMPANGIAFLTYDGTQFQLLNPTGAFLGDSGAGGRIGLVPAPSAGDAAASKFLFADGTWQVVNTGATVITSIINGTFQYFRRGATLASTAGGDMGYLADRWGLYNTVVGRTTSQQNSGLAGFQYCARVQRDNGIATLSSLSYIQAFETRNSRPYQGQNLVLTFYARKGANFSSTSNFLSSIIDTGTGVDDTAVNEVNGAWAGQVTNSQANTLTGSFQRFTYTVAIASTVNQIGIRFQYTPTGTAGAADYFEITGVEVKLGTTATNFTFLPSEIVLFQCQRYYQVFGGTNNGFPLLYGVATGAAQNQTATMTFPVQMRVAPTGTKLGTWTASNTGQPTISFITNDGFSLRGSSTGAGEVAAFPDSADDLLTFSAEL